MSYSIRLSLRDSRLLRGCIRTFLQIRDGYLKKSDPQSLEALSDVAGLLGETLLNLEKELPITMSTHWKGISAELMKRSQRAYKRSLAIDLLENIAMKDPSCAIAIEMLSGKQHTKLNKSRKKLQRCLSEQRMQELKELISNLETERGHAPAFYDPVENRMKEFLAFRWSLTPSQDEFSSLRIRAQNVRIALLMQKHSGGVTHRRLLSRLDQLKLLLDRVEHLSEYEETIAQLIRNWNSPQSRLISSSLMHLEQRLMEERATMLGDVYPLYASAVQSFVSSLRTVPVRSSTATPTLKKTAARKFA